MEIDDHKSLLDLARLKLEPKSNYYICEFCGLQIETTSKSFFNTDLNELEFIDLLNTLLIYFRIFTMELDKGDHPDIFTSKHIIHLSHKGKTLCHSSPIDIFNILKNDTSFIEIKTNKNEDHSVV
jgi:hypothetical protein